MKRFLIRVSIIVSVVLGARCQEGSRMLILNFFQRKSYRVIRETISQTSRVIKDPRIFARRKIVDVSPLSFNFSRCTPAPPLYRHARIHFLCSRVQEIEYTRRHDRYECERAFGGLVDLFVR